jgi:putative aldouronate transport system substrate-binding protein
MKSSKFLLAGLVCLGMFLAACGMAATEAPMTVVETQVVEVTVEVEKAVEEPAAEEAPAAAAPLMSPEIAPIVLTWRLPGEAPPDEALIEGALNAMPQVQNLGLSIDLAFSGSEAYPETLGAIISQGLPCDLAYTSSDLEYARLAGQGVFIPLDELVNNFAPDIFMMVPKPAWDMARVNDLVYAVPALTGWGEAYGVIADQQILEKYQVDLNSLNNYSSLEAVLQSVLQGEPALAKKLVGEIWAIGDPRSWGYEPVSLPGVVRMSDPQKQVVNWYATPEYLLAVELANRLHQAGYTPDQPLIPANLLEARKQGEYPFHMAIYRPDLLAQMNRDEGRVHLGKTLQPILLSGVLNHLSAICANTQSAERALQFLDLVYTDEAVFNTLAKGVEGVHWGWQDIGRKIIARATGSGWTPEGDWLFGNPMLAYAEDSGEVGMWQAVKRQNDGARIPVDGAFSFDPAAVAAQIETVQSLIVQYDNPMRWGLVLPGDPHAGIETFNRMLQGAGLDQVLQEMQRQLDAYLEANPWVNQ